MKTYLAALTLLVALLAHPVDAQLFATFEDRTFEPSNHPDPRWLPLQVGNKSTYEHVYFNIISSSSYPYLFDGLPPLEQAILRIVLDRPDGPALVIKRFTIEITHTERIGGMTYYVFSDVDYNWPPVPNLFLADKKVATTGAFPGPDLYEFSPHHISPYFIPDYPLLYDGNQRGTLRVQRELWNADDERLPGYILSTPPAGLSQEAAASFRFSSERIALGEVWFVSGYGLASYHLQEWGYSFEKPFRNEIYPVSAFIDGKEIGYPYKNPGITHVRPISWGQVKAHYGQGP